MKTSKLSPLLAFGLVFWCAHLGLAAASPFGTYRCVVPSGTNDLGSVVSYSIRIIPGETNPVVRKGISVRLGKDSAADVCFDTELLRYAFGWTGGTLDVSKTLIGSGRGSGAASVVGKVRFVTPEFPGWTEQESFVDPRPLGLGSLPHETARYGGLYRHGGRVVWRYTVGRSEILDAPGFESGDGIDAFVRTISCTHTEKAAGLLVCEGASQAKVSFYSLTNGAPMVGAVAGKTFARIVAANGEEQLVAVVGAPEEAVWQATAGNRVVLRLPAHDTRLLFKVIVANTTGERVATFPQWLAQHREFEDPASLTHDAPKEWEDGVPTEFSRGKDDAAYVLDTVGLPDRNPWSCWLRPSAFDFFSDGRAAVCTLSGDVWIVSDLDDPVRPPTWKRFASGLYEPLGLKIVDDVLYVLGRDQITRLHDGDGLGEANYYENFNNDRVVSPVYHAFAFDLQTDSHGNFYYIAGGNLVRPDLPHHSAVIRVSRDGSHLDTYATGFRAPNGLAIGPGDLIVGSDNQGHWTPASRINVIRPGGFYGYPGDPRQPAGAPSPMPSHFDPPLCWLPMNADNSSGGEVWAESEKWGPLNHHWIHTSYGKCWLYYLMTQAVGPEMQAGAVRFPFTCASGVMRARFNPHDGQLYVCGLKGWQTSAVKDGCFQRVRYTGKPLTTPVNLRVDTRGAELEFSSPLDPASARDASNYSVSQWNYRWTSTYGSEHYSVADPQKKGEDTVLVEKVTVSPDRRKVLLALRNLAPVMQMRIRFTLKSAEGNELSQEVFNTINSVPGEPRSTE